MAASKETDEWIFDAIVAYLNTPKWKTRMVSFIEDNCLFFDDEAGSSPEEYEKIFEKYALMMESMITELVKDLKITAEQFVKVCTEANKHPQNKKAIELILSATDFRMFKKLMQARNKELYERALRMLNVQQQERREVNVVANSNKKEEEDLAAAIKESLELEEKRKKLEEKEKEILEEVLWKSKLEYEEAQQKSKLESSSSSVLTSPGSTLAKKEKSPLASTVIKKEPKSIIIRKNKGRLGLSQTIKKLPETLSPTANPDPKNLLPPVKKTKSRANEEGILTSRIDKDFLIEEGREILRKSMVAKYEDSLVQNNEEQKSKTIIPCVITKDMIREKKRQILKDERKELQQELTKAEEEKEIPEDPELAHKRKIAEAIKTIINEKRQEQGKVNEETKKLEEEKVKEQEELERKKQEEEYEKVEREKEKMKKCLEELHQKIVRTEITDI